MSQEFMWRFDEQEIMIHAAHVVGRLIEEVSIVLDKTAEYKGYCRFSAFIEPANDHNEWLEANKSLDHITVIYAGMVAVEIICNLHGWDYKQLRHRDANDREVVNRLCRELFVEQKQRMKVKRERLRQAKEILLSHWEAVDALATELLQVGWVTGGEAHQIIRQVSDETESDWRLVTWEI